ncbi:hypothetical protein EOPP23_03210 [Endozoicomonas sp. OPT23]|uniref:hypothetical protein n=1 Tax=Endozoicomonas sp. OPT23 TaxID=2072845 RepID=UPI00129A9398|nr:hypothetical protein [Endozoicomonas sp. OPT23]MRI32007.1 hypothetical protein [Endozoicomonas sp. OPT23]
MAGDSKKFHLTHGLAADNSVADVILENTINPALDLLKCPQLESRSEIERLALEMKGNREFHDLVRMGKDLLETGQFSQARRLTHSKESCDQWLETYFRQPFSSNHYLFR